MLERSFFQGTPDHPGFGAHWCLFDEEVSDSSPGFARLYGRSDTGRFYEKREGTVRSFAFEQQTNIFTVLNRFKDLELDDQDATPVASRRLRTIDGRIRATDTSNVEGRHISKASIEQLAIADLSDAADVIKSDGSVAFTADQSLGGNQLTSVGDPANPQDAATKAYVDAIASGLDLKPSVRLATAAALPANTYDGGTKRLTADANGALSVDGVTAAANDRVLVKNEGAGPNNGIFKVIQIGDAGTPWILERAADFDASAEVTAGAFTFVAEGTANADTGWVLVTNDAIVLDTTSLSFTQFTAVSSYTDEEAQDAVGGILDDGTVGDVDFTYDDATPKISAVIKPGMVWATVKKTADESVNADDTLQDDDHLQVALEASSTYAVRLVAFFDTLAAADFKYRILGPAAPVRVRRTLKNRGGGGGAIQSLGVKTDFDAADVQVLGTGVAGVVEEEMLIETDVTPGTLKFQWAQDAATTGDTTVFKGSYLSYIKIA